MTEKKRKNNHSWHDRLSHAGVLRILRRNVLLQASLAVLTIVLTIVLVFSLTVAWYTNVVQTGGMDFQAEKWNFDGKIELLNQSPVMVSPGDEGIVPIRLSNNGDHIVAVSTTVDKTYLGEHMGKRMYFYVDTPLKRNGENIDRVYISQKNSYTYTIPPHSTLELSDTVRNGPLIKWMWVYDVLGYYVWGQGDGSSVTISDYIRPVEYEYDPITTTFTEAGDLLTVDGSMTVSQFVLQLTESDGYAGTVTSDEGKVDGYYPISVNEDGYGVWLYLCTQADIQKNMEIDKNLGVEETSCQATLVITGANSREDRTPVSSAQELQVALSDPTVGIIQLSNDMVLTDTLIVSNTSASIDLNGKTLSIPAEVERILSLTDDANLLIENGFISGTETVQGQTAVFISESHLTMNQVTVSHVKTGIRVEDHTATVENSSTVYMNGSTIIADSFGVFVYGNQNSAATRTQVVLRNSIVAGNDYAGIIYNGSYGGIDTLISDCEVSGLYTSIYHPAKNSTLTIEKSKLEGGTGLVVKGGNVKICRSTVHGNMKEVVKEPEYMVSGWSDTGDGIYLEANYATQGKDTNITVAVVDCIVTSDFAYAVRKFEYDAANASMTVQSGKYTFFAQEGVPSEFKAIEYMSQYVKGNKIEMKVLDDGKTCTVTETPES